MWKKMKADIIRYKDPKKKRLTISVFYHHVSIFSVILFRLIQGTQKLSSFLSFPLKLIYKFFSVLLLGIHIDFRAKIGKGFYVGHHGGIIIGPIEMGEYCNVSPMVTIGHGGRGTERHGVPKFGDYVYIAPGAKIFGKIIIGNNVSIGANAVVSKDVPDNAIIVGNPARIVGYQEKNIYLDNVFEKSQSNDDSH
jgi:serine acetyltransferase